MFVKPFSRWIFFKFASQKWKFQKFPKPKNIRKTPQILKNGGQGLLLNTPYAPKEVIDLSINDESKRKLYTQIWVLTLRLRLVLWSGEEKSCSIRWWSKICSNDGLSQWSSTYLNYRLIKRISEHREKNSPNCTIHFWRRWEPFFFFFFFSIFGRIHHV